MSAPQKPSDPRPDNRPYYADPNCDVCGSPLMLSDVLAGNTDKIWYDEWICPNHVEAGIIMDWPHEMIEGLRARFDDAQAVTLADHRADGGFKLDIHPDALAELKASGLDIDEVLEQVEDEAVLERFKEQTKGPN